MNPNALLLWAITAIVGYLITDTIKGAVVGLLVGLLISFIAEFIPTRRRY